MPRVTSRSITPLASSPSGSELRIRVTASASRSRCSRSIACLLFQRLRARDPAHTNSTRAACGLCHGCHGTRAHNDIVNNEDGAATDRVTHDELVTQVVRIADLLCL